MLQSFPLVFFFFFKQKTAYEMRISDWSSDVCSSDLDPRAVARGTESPHPVAVGVAGGVAEDPWLAGDRGDEPLGVVRTDAEVLRGASARVGAPRVVVAEHEHGAVGQIGRASCRERVCQYV